MQPLLNHYCYYLTSVCQVLIDHVFDNFFGNFFRDISILYLLFYHSFTIYLIVYEIISIRKHIFRVLFYNWKIELEHLIQSDFKNEQIET